MQALQPMQAALSKSTIPSSRRYIAEVGQAVMQGASSHWLQRVTWKGAPRLRKDSNVDVFHIRARDRERNLVLGLAGSRAGVAADAARLVDDLPQRSGRASPSPAA